ncbi:MAG: deoxyribonuclease IV [Fimbriimonas sp.]
MAATLLGAHRPAAGGIHNAIRSGHEIGCTAVQVFTSSPQSWKAKPVTPEMVAAYRKSLEETGISEVVSHDSYLINLCAPDPDKRRQGMDGMRAEIERCALYGIDRVVSHMGSHVGQGEECGLQGVAESIKEVLETTPETVTVCMETTAGQGTSLMAKFEHLAYVIEALKGHPRLGICMDTCHIFAAGYDIRTEETFTATMAEFDRVVGFDRLKVVHCNDSKKGLGTRVDRHAHLGEGEIGEEAFRLLVNDPRFARIPILLETEIENEGHEKDLAKLKSFL